MPALDRQLSAGGQSVAGPAPVSALVLARIATQGGATRADVRRDLQPMVAHRLSPAEWREAAERAADEIVAAGLATESRGRLAASDTGAAEVARLLGRRATATATWSARRDVDLVAKSLGLEGESAVKLKALSKPEGLRALVVQKAFGLPLRPRQSAARLRADLAVIALERAFGNKIKSGLGAGSGLSAKAGRLLAGQLALRPREYPSDGRLVAQLAAEAVGTPQASLEALRTALLRDLVTRLLAPAAPPAAQPLARAAPRPANDLEPAASGLPPLARPDLDGFSAEVLIAARGHAEGWPGNRKAFISRVWQAIRAARPEWGLSEIEFKGMLAEAHRAGRLVLANADLKDKKNLKDFEDSAIGYKNTVWHFVRIED
jgi:hypothetical protein